MSVLRVGKPWFGHALTQLRKGIHRLLPSLSWRTGTAKPVQVPHQLQPRHKYCARNSMGSSGCSLQTCPTDHKVLSLRHHRRYHHVIMIITSSCHLHHDHHQHHPNHHHHVIIIILYSLEKRTGSSTRRVVIFHCQLRNQKRWAKPRHLRKPLMTRIFTYIYI